jgi:hypothetical protein
LDAPPLQFLMLTKLLRDSDINPLADTTQRLRVDLPANPE